MARKFASLTTAELTSMKTAILAAITGTVTNGVQGYSIKGRTLSNYSPKELADILDDVSNEIAARAIGDDGFGIALVEFNDP